jgi:sensor histidine kinase YesM
MGSLLLLFLFKEFYKVPSLSFIACEFASAFSLAIIAVIAISFFSPLAIVTSRKITVSYDVILSYCKAALLY